MEKIKTINYTFKSWATPFRILALMISWFYNESVLWGIFHFIFGIPYLIYSMLIGRFSDGNLETILTSYF